MSWKEWDQGEVVEAGDLQEYIQDQVVQNYADSAARSTALGTAVAEGMVSYLQDSNSVEVYDGSAWVAVGSDLSAGTEGYTALSNGTAGLSYQPVSHNYIINGAFDIWQRGDGPFTMPSSGYTADRFRSGASGATGTISKVEFTANDLTAIGYGEGQYFYRADVTVGDNFNLLAGQKIEDVRSLANQEVTLSFYAKGVNPGGGSFFTRVQQEFGSGGSANIIALGAGFSVTSSWQRFTFTFTMPSISGKTIEDGSLINWFISTLGDSSTDPYTLDLWGVQLEAGSIATPFKRNANSIQGELAACQRYYITTDTSPSTTMIYSATTSGGFSPNAYHNYRFPVQMRATPTITFYAHDGTAGAVSLYVSSSPIKSTTVASIGASPWGWSGNFAGNSPSWGTNADSGLLALGFEAEAEL